MDIVIDRASRVPIYRQIVDRLREMIVSGVLPEGFRLPPERRLADDLQVNRSTVLNAYRELKGDGLLDAHVGRGTVVLAPPQPSPASQPAALLPWRQLLREGVWRSQDPLLRDLLEAAGRPGVISLSIGLPAPELLPLQVTGEILERLLSEVGASLLMQSPTEGLGSLRETISDWLAGRDISCTANEVLILSGSQQGLDLLARVILDPGDTVVVEEPTYIGAIEVFRRAQARLIAVPCDGDGINTDLLAQVLQRHSAKLIYTLPTFQNPSGAVLSAPRRRRLLQLAYRHQVPVVEDDPYCELRYQGEDVPALKSLDEHGHVLYLGTFSKLVYPGLRIGFLVAPQPVLRQLVLAKQACDLHCNTPGQWLLERFLAEGHFAAHLRRTREAYARRRTVMHDALCQAAVDGVTWQPPPGGFYFWCRLPDTTERARLLARAMDSGVAFLPGWSCYIDDPPDTHLRLNFTFASEQEIRQGVARLMRAVQEAATSRSPPPGAATGTPAIV